ncbi:MAG: COG1470 family protein [Thermoproteota archaeon]
MEEYSEKARKIILLVAIIAVILIVVIIAIALGSSVFSPVPQPKEFELMLNTTSLEVNEDDSAHILVTLVTQDSFDEDVFLGIGSMPTGMSFRFSNQVLNVSWRQSVLTLNASGVIPGSYYITILGSSSKLAREAVLKLTVKKVEKPWFEASVKIYPEKIIRMESFFMNISLTPHGEIREVELIISLPGSRPNVSMVKPGIQTVEIYTSRDTPVGFNNFTTILRSAEYMITINSTVEIGAMPPDFNAYISPSVVMVKPGDTVNLRITVEPNYEFNEVVVFHQSILDDLRLDRFNGSRVLLTPGNYSAVISMTINKVQNPPKIYYLTFAFNASSKKEFKTVRLGVANVSYLLKDCLPGIISSRKIVEASPGSSIYLDLLIGSLNGYGGELYLRVLSKDIGIYSFCTGEGFPVIGEKVEKINVTSGWAGLVELRYELYTGVQPGEYRVDVELCEEYLPPNMSFPLLKPVSRYTFTFRVR